MDSNQITYNSFSLELLILNNFNLESEYVARPDITQATCPENLFCSKQNLYQGVAIELYFCPS